MNGRSMMLWHCVLLDYGTEVKGYRLYDPGLFGNKFYFPGVIVGDGRVLEAVGCGTMEVIWSQGSKVGDQHPTSLVNGDDVVHVVGHASGLHLTCLSQSASQLTISNSHNSNGHIICAITPTLMPPH